MAVREKPTAYGVHGASAMLMIFARRLRNITEEWDCTCGPITAIDKACTRRFAESLNMAHVRARASALWMGSGAGGDMK
jgi:hypothetical protein